MGEDPEEIVKDPEDLKKEIEDTRKALGEKVDALAGQLKHNVETVKNTGMKIVGVVVAALVGILTLKTIRRRKR